MLFGSTCTLTVLDGVKIHHKADKFVACKDLLNNGTFGEGFRCCCVLVTREVERTQEFFTAKLRSSIPLTISISMP